MKSATWLLFFFLVGAPFLKGASLRSRGCTKPECFAATAWHEGYAAVIIDSDDPTAGERAAGAIGKLGGRIAIITPNVLLGWIPADVQHQVIGTLGIASIAQAPVDITAARFRRGTFRSRQGEIALQFFNEVTSGALAARFDRAIGVRGKPLVNDVMHHEDVRAQIAAASTTKRPRASSESFSPPWTNERMTGIVEVNIFELESDGSIDANAYSWTTSDFSDVTSQALAGLSFWSSQAGTYGRSVSFRIDVWEPYNVPCNQGYEPIRHSAADDYLWINEVMRKFDSSFGGRPGGYGASPVTYTNVFNNVEQFNNDQAHLPGHIPADWAYTVFVAYNPAGAGAPSTFTDGRFAYVSTFGGPWVQMLFTNDGWGTNNFTRILTHETGHVFWACDEYYQAGYGGCSSCSNCRSFGPRLAAPNRNCANPSASCPINVICMMKGDDFALCDDTPTQIGWRE